MTMSATPTADLLAHARERRVPLTRQGAQSLGRRLGAERARERLDSIGALIDLASAFGRQLSALSAARRLDAAAGDFDDARDRLLDEIEGTRSRAFDRAWREHERAFYDDDAHRRHAAFLAELDRGSLGHRATLLLLAAAEAGLTRPSAAARRAQLWGLCDVELARRHAVDEHAGTRADVIATIAEETPDDPIERAAFAAAHERYLAHTAAAEAAERLAREMAEQQLLADDGDRDLAITVNRLADDAAFRGDVERVLASIRSRLADALARDDAGAWRPDPERFHTLVVLRAAAAARQAA